jgi:23S rRNA (uridine2552-2'-O)-methyltransferase
VRLRASHPGSFRSRSAFKLLELERDWGGFLSGSDVRAVVDLGAAPGGWSQVVSGKLGWMDIGEHNVQARDMLERRKGREKNARGEKIDTLRQSQESLGTLSVAAFEEGLLLDEDAKPTEPLVGWGTILALDLLPISPIPGVQTLQLDFLHPSTAQILASLLPDGKADVVLSDMAPNMSGNRIRDEEMGKEICQAVWEFARTTLRSGTSSDSRKKGVLL